MRADRSSFAPFSPPPAHPAIVELGARPQWVAWALAERDGNLTKPPISARTGRGASHSRPADWAGFDQVVAFASSQGMAGIGFVTTEDDGITGVDLDKCRDPDTGAIEPWARDVLDLAETYAEVSPSGRGIRMFWRGKIDATVKADAAQVEIYRSQRYLTVTGRHIEGTPTDIRPAPRTKAALLDRVRRVKAGEEAAASLMRATTVQLRENDDGTAVDLTTGEIFESLEEAQRAQLAPSTSTPPVAGHKPGRSTGDDFFRTVNARSLAALPAWVGSIFPTARYQATTGAYRVSSRDLGRNLQEDLSIAPNGIVDFGIADMGDGRQGKRTAIDIVMEHGPCSDAVAAALWLCDRLGLNAEALGWQPGSDIISAAIGENAVSGLLAKNRAFENAPQTAKRLRIIAASDFAGKLAPVRKFLDEAGLIPCRNVTMLSGDGGTGKSLLAMQLGCGVSVSGQWIGLRVKDGPVLHYSAEDDEDETHIRLDDVSTADGFSLSDAGRFKIALLAGEDAVLATENPRTSTMAFTPLYSELERVLDEQRPVLLVLDNLADIFAGNENVKTLARQFVGKLRGLAIRFDCAIVILSHPSQSGMASGSGTSGNTAWSNSVRSRLYLHRDVHEDGSEPNPNRRWLSTKKSNYGPVGGEIGLEWQGGRFVRIDQPTTGGAFDGVARVMKAERVFMDLLRWHLRHDKFVSPNRSVSYAPAQFARHQQSEGVKKHEFENAMNALLDRDEIMIFTHGSASSRRQHIGLPVGREEAA